jgi:hypothetical protein
VQETAVTRRGPGRALILKSKLIIPADVPRPDESVAPDRGQLKRGTADVVVLSQQSDYRHMALRRPYLAMSTAEAHQLTVSGERLTMQMASVFRRFDASHDGTSDHCIAPMSNDCHACGSAQASVRRPISLEHLRKSKGRRPQTGRECCLFAGYPCGQIKAVRAGADHQDI